MHRRGVRIEWFIVAWNPVEGSFCQNRNVVGTLINHRPTTAVVTIVVTLIVSLNVFLLYQTFFA